MSTFPEMLQLIMQNDPARPKKIADFGVHAPQALGFGAQCYQKYLTEQNPDEKTYTATEFINNCALWPLAFKKDKKP